MVEKKSRVIFWGSDAIALPLLEVLLEAAVVDLVAIVSQPDRPKGRGQKLISNPVAAWAADKGIVLLQPVRPDEGFVDQLKALEPDLAYVMAYGHILRKNVRAVFPLGMLNLHGSLLPQLRGASPVETAVALGFRETGVSLMRIVAKMDAGPVADREVVEIASAATGVEVRLALGAASARLVGRNLKAACAGTLDFVPQDEGAVTYCRKLTKEDGALDFNQSANALVNRIRAFQPWPGAYFDLSCGTRVKVGAATVDMDFFVGDAVPGAVVGTGGDLRIATGEGCIVLTALQKPGGRMLPSAEFLRGFPIESGAVLISNRAPTLLL